MGLVGTLWTVQVLAAARAKAAKAPAKILTSYNCEDSQYAVGIVVYDDEISSVQWKVVNKATKATAKYSAIILGSSPKAFGASSIDSDIDVDGTNNTAILTIAGVDSNLTCKVQ